MLFRSRYAAPRGDYKVYEDVKGGQWYAVPGEASVERKPVYENGKPVYDGDKLRTTQVATVRYSNQPTRYAVPQARPLTEIKSPRRKH